MEFIGDNNRYYKYRYPYEHPTNFGTVEESWLIDSQAKKFLYAGKFIEKVTNVKINFDDHKIPFDDFINIENKSEAFKDMHFILFPMDLSTIHFISKYFTSSGIFDATDTIIVSNQPQRYESNTWSILAIDDEALILILLFVIKISAFLTAHSIYKRSLTTPLPSEIDVFRYFKKTLWSTMNIFFFEPFPNLPTSMSPRIVVGIWLLSVTIILSFFNCYLSTEYTFETYVYIDTLEDLKLNQHVKPLLIKGAMAYWHLKKKAETDRAIFDWIRSTNKESFISMMDLLYIDKVEDVFSGKKALIINKMYFTWLFGYSLASDAENRAAVKEKFGRLYVSKKSIKMDYLIFPINKNFLTDSHLMEFSITGVLPFFECKPFKYLDNLDNYHIDSVTWTKPSKEFETKVLWHVLAPFAVYAVGSALSFVLFLIEVISAPFELSQKKKRRKHC